MLDLIVPMAMVPRWPRVLRKAIMVVQCSVFPFLDVTLRVVFRDGERTDVIQYIVLWSAPFARTYLVDAAIASASFSRKKSAGHTSFRSRISNVRSIENSTYVKM